MKTVALAGGEQVPALGLGTWRMGESARSRRAEVEAVRFALEIGYRLIDTAEMYGEGGAEEVVGEAIALGPVRREEVFIVSKVYPHNASRKGTVAACERSLKRLRIRPHRPVPVALARLRSVVRDRGGVRTPAQPRQDPALEPGAQVEQKELVER